MAGTGESGHGRHVDASEFKCGPEMLFLTKADGTADTVTLDGDDAKKKKKKTRGTPGADIGSLEFPRNCRRRDTNHVHPITIKA